MIRHKVHHDFKSGCMCTLDKGFEFHHSVRYRDRNIRVNVVIIFDRIWRSGFPFYNHRIVSTYAILGIICGLCMLNHTGIPYMGNTEIAQFAKHYCSNIIQFATTILFDGAVGDTFLACIAKKPWQHLIYYRFPGICAHGLFSRLDVI